MSFFGKNIKKIRAVKKLSQSSFADIFQLKRGSIGAYEEGRAEAKIETIICIADYFKLSLDQLLKNELTINEISHLNSINKKFDHSKSIKKENNIPYITITDKHEFIQSYGELAFLDQLPKIYIPFVTKKHIAFECFNSSMLGQFSGIKQGDILISKLIKIDDIIDLPEQNIIIILYDIDLIIGLPRIIAKELILYPLNMNFPKHYVPTEKVKKVWLVKKIITDSFIKEETIEQRIQNIENLLEKLK